MVRTGKDDTRPAVPAGGLENVVGSAYIGIEYGSERFLATITEIRDVAAQMNDAVHAVEQRLDAVHVGEVAGSVRFVGGRSFVGVKVPLSVDVNCAWSPEFVKEHRRR